MATTATFEIQVDVPDGITIGEYERIGQGHAFHVSWDLPERCRCETCQQKMPLQRVEKDKFLVIRDLDLWGQPVFDLGLQASGVGFATTAQPGGIAGGVLL